jgi:HK97 family phage prohead protease
MNIKFASKRDETLDFAVEIKKDDITPEGIFKGYASTFEGPPDSVNDIVEFGAFKKTIKNGGRNGNGIALLWSHDSRAPIGAWSIIQEDKTGLYVEGIIEPTAMPNGIPILKVMRLGGVKGLSIGFNTVKYDIDKEKQIRRLKELELWEISLCTFPANTRASVTSVKNILSARTERELEDALRDAGMSREASKYLVKLTKSGLREANKSEDNQDMSSILAELQRINTDLSIREIQNAIACNF